MSISKRNRRASRSTPTRKEIETSSSRESGIVSKKRIAAAAERAQRGTDELIDRLTQQADAAVEHLEEVEAKVDDLYEVIAKKGTAGAFHDEAKNQARAANTWRWIAVVFGAAAVAVAVVSAFVVDPDDFGWEQLVAKLTVTVGLGAIAAYAGRQSGRHREREEDAKHLELDLAAIGPFVAEFPDGPSREAARKAFIERWMSSRSARGSVSDDGHVNGLSATQLLSLLQRAGRAA